MCALRDASPRGRNPGRLGRRGAELAPGILHADLVAAEAEQVAPVDLDAPAGAGSITFAAREWLYINWPRGMPAFLESELADADVIDPQ